MPTPLVGALFMLVSTWSAACPLTLPLDDAMRAPASFGDFLTRDVTYFMLAGLTDGSDAGIADHGDTWTVDCAALPAALVEPLRATVSAVDGTVDSRALREVFETNFHVTIAQRHQDGVIKSTEAALRSATAFDTWPKRIVEFSTIKRKSRRIFRSPPGFKPVTSVSQTLNTESGDETAEVLETEVAVKRLGSEDWDFYAYNHDGNLSEYSTFPAGQRPSPRICVNCHYDAGTRAVERFLP